MRGAAAGETPGSGWGRPFQGALPRIFAHRCGGALAPENTLAGLHVAAALGCSAVEFDVMLSGDGTPWLIHDETLDRTTNGSGRVCESSDAFLRSLDAGVAHHPAFSGEPLPTLAAAAACCRRLGLFANVEIKPSGGTEARTGRIVAQQVRDLWRGSPPPLLSSFSEAALRAAHEAAPELPLGRLWSQLPDDCLQQLKGLHCVSLHCPAEALSEALVAEAHANQIAVLCYTVNGRGQAETLFRLGVDALFSDRPDLLLPVLRASA